MSGIAGGKSGTPEQVAEVSEFTHLTEPDGTVYPHLLADALTALALVLGLGADKEKAIASLKRFTPGGHRIQTVATATTQDGGSIRFVDDSKATNAHAAKASLDSFADKSVVWIAGGTDKGNDYEPLKAFARAKVHTLVCMGLDNAKLVREFTGVVPEVVSTDSLEAAMTASKAAARPGDAVLLSPACASFDLFRNYENRGELFKNWVEEKA